MPDPSPATAAFVDRFDRLFVRDHHGDAPPPPVASGARWPTWLLNSGRLELAYSAERDGAWDVVIQNCTTGDTRTAYKSAAVSPQVIAPGIPHYVCPSPTGTHLAVAAPASNGLVLSILNADGTEASRSITGGPLFPSWSPDGRFLAVHAGAEVIVVDTSTGDRHQATSSDAQGFRTPAYADDGTLCYVVTRREQASLRWSSPDGKDWQHGQALDAGVICQFRPGTDEVYLGAATVPASGVLDRLLVCRPGDSSPMQVFRGPFVAFSWAPAGKCMVLVVPAQTGDGRYILTALAPDGSRLGQSESFTPSAEQRAIWSFFDQYSLSHSSWSTTEAGDRFHFSGRVGTDLLSPSLGPTQGNSAWRWNPTRGAAVEPLGIAELVVPAPRPAE